MKRTHRTNPFGIAEDDKNFYQKLTAKVATELGAAPNVTEAFTWLEEWNHKEEEEAKKQGVA